MRVSLQQSFELDRVCFIIGSKTDTLEGCHSLLNSFCDSQYHTAMVLNSICFLSNFQIANAFRKFFLLISLRSTMGLLVYFQLGLFYQLKISKPLLLQRKNKASFLIQKQQGTSHMTIYLDTCSATVMLFSGPSSL